MFDVDKFMNSQQSGSVATEYVNVPDNEYHAIVAQVDKPSPVDVDGDRRWKFDVHWELQDLDGELKKVTGRDKNRVRQSLWLDLTPTGDLDTGTGMNVKLGQLLQAVGLHGKKWGMNDLMGRSCLVRTGTTPNKKDPNGQPYVNVTATVAVA